MAKGADYKSFFKDAEGRENCVMEQTKGKVKYWIAKPVASDSKNDKPSLKAVK
jgi:hypothetical protein